jgi:hypothetical protein
MLILLVGGPPFGVDWAKTDQNQLIHSQTAGDGVPSNGLHLQHDSVEQAQLP